MALTFRLVLISLALTACVTAEQKHSEWLLIGCGSISGCEYKGSFARKETCETIRDRLEHNGSLWTYECEETP